MNVGVGMQTSVRIYYEFAMTIWAMVNTGESFALIFGAWVPTEGLTVTLALFQIRKCALLMEN